MQTRIHRCNQRGNVVVVVSLILVGLGALAALTVLSVQRTLGASGHERFRAIALYAAESGAAVTMDYLRANRHPTGHWSALCSPSNTSPVAPPSPGNGAQPGEPGNFMAGDSRAWYEVLVFNNLDDPGFASGQDQDARVLLQVTGHGPDGTVARVEWDVHLDTASGATALTLMGWRQVF